jgi:hypothetical protein
LAGRKYAKSLMTPGNMMAQPRCPYWWPRKRHYWHLGFSAGLWEAMYQDG